MKTVLITGDRSGAGKTSITVALAALLSKKYSVQTFKVGMDYIDPSYLTAVTGRPCRNLDTFVMKSEEIREIFSHACQGADIALIEGVRGLFEGSESINDTGSTASVAKLLGVPVVLVIDARSITRSAAAILKGFQSFDPDITISGVILNNVRGEGHIRKATEAIRHFCGVPVIGAVPRLDTQTLTMRHLGLIPYQEGAPDQGFRVRISEMVEEISDHIDTDALLNLAADMQNDRYKGRIFNPKADSEIRIAVARDEAFNFYYADLFPILQAAGSEIRFFSPLHDALPDADGIIIGGGYPEYFGVALRENAAVREEIRQASQGGLPLYAECGGLMYLCQELRFTKDWQGLSAGGSFEMCGVFPGFSSIPSRRVVSYVIGTSSAETPFGEQEFRGHEFHYSDVQLPPGTRYGYELSRGIGISGSHDGALSQNTLGSYTHLHPTAARSMFNRFCETCRSR
jgi:cobyrinic acid a,c-diamide synthase